MLYRVSRKLWGEGVISGRVLTGGRWLGFALLCGVLSALLCLTLIRGVEGVQSILSPVPHGLRPIVGAVILLALLRLTRFPLQGTGTDTYILAVHGKVPPLGSAPALGKLLATIGVVGSGGSGGLAGPALYIGAGMAHSFSGFITVGSDDHRYLQLMGASSMLAALLQAPLAAAVLACEILYRQSIRLKDLPVALMGSWSGYIIYGWLGGGRPVPIVPVPSVGMSLLAGGFFAAVLASFLGIILVVGLRILSCHQQPLGGWLIFAGAALTGVLGWWAGESVLGWGVPSLMNEAASGILQPSPYLLLALVKGAATIFTVGSGGSGGLIGPALVIGGWGGQAVASLLGYPAQGLMWAGMAAGLATISNVPWAAGILMLELFGISAWPYALLGSGTGFMLARSWVAYGALSILPDEVTVAKRTKATPIH